MSPIIPFVVAAMVITGLSIGERLGNNFLFVLAMAGAGLLIYAVWVVISDSKTVLHSQLIPFTAGLAAAAAVGASGLGFGGIGDRWSSDSLLLAILAATAAMAGTRSLLPKAQTG